MWRKARIYLALLLAMVTASNADTPPAAKEQLRKLAAIPNITIVIGFNLDNTKGFSTLGEESDTTEQIATLLKAFDGGPEDAEHYHRLFQLYRDQKLEPQKAVDALSNSIALYRRRVAAQPDDGRLLADFGSTLQESPSNRLEAEQYLRKAVQLSSNDWHAWHALGEFLLGRANFFLEHGTHAWEHSEDLLPPVDIRQRPSESTMEASQNSMNEAMECYDKEVSAAPTNPVVYQNRGLASMSLNYHRVLLKSYRLEELNHIEQVLPFYAGQGEDDFIQLAKLDPRNYRAIDAVIRWEILTSFENLAAVSKSSFKIRSADEFWQALPDKSRAIVRDQMAALHKLGDDSDKRLAAGALEAEGGLQMTYVHDDSAAQSNFRKALTLDPSRERAGVCLIMFASKATNYNEMLSICAELVKHKETVNSLLFLADAHMKLGQLDAAIPPLERAITIAPDDPAPQLGLAAVFLKNTDDESLAKAAAHIKLSRAVLNKLPNGEGTAQQESGYLFTAGLYQGLVGNSDRAREAFNLILKHDPNHQGAKAALAALGN